MMMMSITQTYHRRGSGEATFLLFLLILEKKTILMDHILGIFKAI